MINLIKKLLKNRVVRYIFFGGCTTLVNVISYACMRNMFRIDITTANLISVLLAILFAYVVNKVYVFESKTDTGRELMAEAGQFIGMRLVTMFIEVFGVVFMVGVWGIQDMLSKIIIQFIVLVLNYLFSKIFVFNQDKKARIISKKEQRYREVRKNCCLGAFFIPVLTMIVAFAANAVFPVGDRAILIIDSLHQYLPFFTEFHEKLVNSDTLLYSFGGGLGFNFWATYAYYLASPINFLVALFPKENMMDVMALFIVLKIGFCGLAMSFYLVYRNKGRNYYPMAFGVMYALSSFIIGYYFNIMWLDSIAMLPFIMLGIERMVQGHQKGCSIYFFSLFYGIYCNYYIGFMLCLFSCLYFLVVLISAQDITVKKIRQSALRFAWYSLLAGGMAAIVLLPAYLGLGITESAENSFPKEIKLFVENLSQLTSQFAFVKPINIADDQIGVNSFCGTAAMLLSCLFLLDQKRSLRERIAKAALAVLLFASFNVNVLNYIWHGFHTQNGLPNRFAFIYIAVLLVMAFDAINDFKQISWKKVYFIWSLLIIFVSYAVIEELQERDIYTYVATISILVVYGFLFILYHTRGMKEYIFRTVFVSLTVLEMIATAIFGVFINGTVGRSTYLDEQKSYEAMIARRQDDDFFRCDLDNTRMRNSNMFLGSNGMVLFSSTMPAATTELCKAVGIEARTNKNGYVGLTKLMNDIFGMKYVVSNTNAMRLYQMENVDYEEPLTMYQNAGALSLGFMVNSKIKEWDITQPVYTEVQNQFVELATGHSPIFYLNQELLMEDGETYTIDLPVGNQVYFDFSEATESLEITTPEYFRTYENFNDHLYDLGCFNEEETATVMADLKEGQTSVAASVYVCDDAAYQEVYEMLADEQMDAQVVKDKQIFGKITAKEAGTLMMSIPYDTGWTVKVDGEEVETYRVGEALTGIDLEAGEHEIEMDYIPAGLKAGTMLTFLFAGLYFLTELIARKRGKA